MGFYDEPKDPTQALKRKTEETERSLKIKLQQDPTRVAQRGESIRVEVPNIGFASYFRYWMILCIYIYICILYTCRYSHFKMVWTMLTPSFWFHPQFLMLSLAFRSGDWRPPCQEEITERAKTAETLGKGNHRCDVASGCSTWYIIIFIMIYNV